MGILNPQNGLGSIVSKSRHANLYAHLWIAEHRDALGNVHIG
jgi:hypothetical protein